MLKKGEESYFLQLNFLITKKEKEGAELSVQYNPFLDVKNKFSVPGTELSSLRTLSHRILEALEKLRNSSSSQKHEDFKRK